MTNDVVRAAEISSILYQNMIQRPFKFLPPAQKVVYILNLPLHFLLYLTVFPTNEFNYSKTRYLLNSILAPLFSIFVLSYRKIIYVKEIWILISIASISLISGLVCFVLLDSKRAPSGRIKYGFQAYGFFVAILWLFMLSDCLISVIIGLNILFNYTYTFMMIAVFSFWAWIPISLGSIKTVILTKEMPGFGGAIFNGFFVFGVSIIVQCGIWGTGIAKMWPEYKTKSGFQIFLYLIFNIFSLVFIYLMVALRAKRYTRILGIVLVFGYLISVIWTFIYGIWAKD